MSDVAAHVRSAVDRLYLRLWWWAEGKALNRLSKSWPLEYRDYADKTLPGGRGDFLTDAYSHLIESKVR